MLQKEIDDAGKLKKATGKRIKFRIDNKDKLSYTQIHQNKT